MYTELQLLQHHIEMIDLQILKGGPIPDHPDHLHLGNTEF